MFNERSWRPGSGSDSVLVLVLTVLGSLLQDEDLQQSEAQMEPDLQSGGPQSRTQIMEDELAAKNMAMEELSRELEEMRAAFGAEGVQQVRVLISVRTHCFKELCRESRWMSGRRMDGRVTLT